MDNIENALKNPFVMFAVLFVLFCGILFLKLNTTDSMHKNDADQFVETVLTNWLNRDNVFNLDLWEDYYKIPPIELITDYEIVKTEFYDDRGRDFGRYLIKLDFPRESTLPSGQTWEMIILRTAEGWRVRDFTLQKDQAP